MLALARCQIASVTIDNVLPGLMTHADKSTTRQRFGLTSSAAPGVAKFRSRPRVSNDNPFIESHFKTMKYRPNYPERFDSISAARSWCRSFFHWYNEVHYHSGIGYLRPADLHAGRHEMVIGRRRAALDAAAQAHPERFTRRPAPHRIPEKAWINRPTIQNA